MKKIVKLGVIFGSLSPFLAFAQVEPQVGANAFSIIGTFDAILKVLIPVLITLAVVYFIWGVITYITAKEEDQKKAAKSKIVNGLIGLFVIVAFWGILRIVFKTFQVGTSVEQNVVPCTPTYDDLGNPLTVC